MNGPLRHHLIPMSMRIEHVDRVGSRSHLKQLQISLSTLGDIHLNGDGPGSATRHRTLALPAYTP